MSTSSEELTLADSVVIAAFDPGQTTGFAVVRMDRPTGEELWWDKRQMSLQHMTMPVLMELMNLFKPDVVLIEDVVRSGRLNEDKFKQICAFDRCVQVTMNYDMGRLTQVHVVPPEQRKRWKEAPRNIGRHGRDAYRHIRAWWMITEGKTL